MAAGFSGLRLTATNTGNGFSLACVFATLTLTILNAMRDIVVICIKEHFDLTKHKNCTIFTHMEKYNLGFVTDEQIFSHVKETVEKYRYHINLAEFNKNLIDPIKLTFDAKVYNKTIKQTIEAECIRQIDKTNTNHIGYFHQNIFKLAEKVGKFLKMVRMAGLM